VAGLFATRPFGQPPMAALLRSLLQNECSFHNLIAAINLHGGD
jgi:hypothetical protein